jgi:hypothetical protein
VSSPCIQEQEGGIGQGSDRQAYIQEDKIENSTMHKKINIPDDPSYTTFVDLFHSVADILFGHVAEGQLRTTIISTQKENFKKISGQNFTETRNGGLLATKLADC